MPAAEKLPAERLWTYDPQTQKFKCKFKDCPYDHDDPQGVRLHYIKKHGLDRDRQNPPAGTSRTAERTSVQTTQKVRQKPSLGHEWRLLNRNIPNERAAYAQGYREVCDDCDELR